MAERPTNELVAVAWLKGVAALGNGVATELPGDVAQWVDDGFVQVATVGGSPNIYYALAQPMVSVDCWAAKPSSARPPWHSANRLAEQIRMATLDHDAVGRLLVLPAAYDNARMLTCWMATEPRRMPGDPADYARYQFDMELRWVAVPK